MAGPKSANFLHTSGPKSPRKMIVRVLEKYVRLVAFTYASPKVNVTASKLVPRKERLGPRGLKRFPKPLVILSYYIDYYCQYKKIFFVYIFFSVFWLRGRMLC